MTYNNIKSHKKPGVQVLFRTYIFKKKLGRGGGGGFIYVKIRFLNTYNFKIQTLKIFLFVESSLYSSSSKGYFQVF